MESEGFTGMTSFLPVLDLRDTTFASLGRAALTSIYYFINLRC